MIPRNNSETHVITITRILPIKVDMIRSSCGGAATQSGIPGPKLLGERGNPEAGAERLDTLVLKLYFEKIMVIRMQAMMMAPREIPSMAT